MSLTVTGALVSEGRRDFSGFRVNATYEVPLGTEQDATVTDRRTALVDASGEFVIELADKDQRTRDLHRYL